MIKRLLIAIYVGICAACIAWVSTGCMTYTNPATGTTRTFVELDKCIADADLGEGGIKAMVCTQMKSEKEVLYCQGAAEASKGIAKTLCARFAKRTFTPE